MHAHIPVLLDEVMGFLDPQPGGRFIDATFGGGGHTAALLERTEPDGKVLAIDRDRSSLDAAAARLESAGSRLTAVHGNFRDVGEIAGEAGFLKCDGVLADV